MAKSVDRYIIGKTLGCGFSAKVKIAHNLDDGKEYAIKIIDLEKLGP